MMTPLDAVLGAAVQAGCLTSTEQDRMLEQAEVSRHQHKFSIWQTMVTVWGALLARNNADHGLGIALALCTRPQDFGLMGALVCQCESLLDGYGMLGRYSLLLHPDIAIQVIKHPRTVEIRYTLARPDPRVPKAILAAGQLWALTNLARLPKEALGVEVTPLCVEFACTMPRPGQWQAAEAVLGCPVRFGQKHFRILFDRTEMERQRELSPRPGRDYLEELARRMEAEVPVFSSMAVQVARVVRERLGTPSMTMPHIASALGVSVRTLQRRLAAEGESFRSLVDGVRRTEAERLLQAGQHTKGQISYRLGYAEQSVLARTLKRWSAS